MKKLTTIISVTAMMCAVMAALIFSIWLAVYGDSNYRFYKKEYQRYEVTEDLDMSIDHVCDRTYDELSDRERGEAVGCDDSGRKRAGFL